MKKSRAAQASPKTAENQQDQLIVADLLQIAQGLSQSLTETRHVLNSEVGWSAARTAWSKVSKHLQLLTASSNRVAAFDVVLSHKSDREFLELEMGLRETFAKQGWKVDGQWPKLFIERAIAVEFIEDSRSAVVGGTKIDHPSVSSIVAVLGPLIQNLVPKNFSAGSFFSKLGEAYDLARTGSSQV